MSYSVKLEKLATDKRKARDIVQEVLRFGVNEQQKLEIIGGIILSLENNEAMKELTATLKKYKEDINKEEETDNNQNKQSKILL